MLKIALLTVLMAPLIKFSLVDKLIRNKFRSLFQGTNFQAIDPVFFIVSLAIDMLYLAGK